MNPIQKTIDQHKKANRKIRASSEKMLDLYRRSRTQINSRLQEYVLSGGAPSDGRWMVELINKLESNYSKLEQSFVKEMGGSIPYVAQSYYFDALSDLGKSVIGDLDTAKIELLQKDAFNHVAGMTNLMRKSDVTFVRQAAADVFRLAGTSGMTVQETKQMLLGKILMRPQKFQFTDAGGRLWNNETYCEMLSRTVLLNAGRSTYFDTCADNGCDVVRVTVSGNPCPACAVWENRLLSITGNTPGLPTVEGAKAAGLLHPNCTHSFVAVGSYIRKSDFDESGRPKEGLNAPGKEERNTKEAWSNYNADNRPQPVRTPKEESPKAVQPEFKFDKRLFAPAESMEEARKYTTEHVAETIALPENTPLDVINKANELIGRNLEELGFEKFRAIKPLDDPTAIAAMPRNNEYFRINPAVWTKIIHKPDEMFDLCVTDPAKENGFRFLAVNKPENFLPHTVDHEFGHAVYNRSTLSHKESLLRGIFEKALQSGDYRMISDYATTNYREFFAESFAMYRRGDTLPVYVKDFIEKVMK